MQIAVGQICSEVNRYLCIEMFIMGWERDAQTAVTAIIIWCTERTKER